MGDRVRVVRVTRRDLLQSLGPGLLATVRLSGQTPGAATRIHFGDDGVITVLTGKVELGQGARTELTQAAAEELRVEPGRVRLLMGDTALVPDDGPTAGSLTTPRVVPLIRQAAAAARKAVLVSPSGWKVLGTSTPAINSRAIVTGTLEYATDVRVEGMLHARIVRPPTYRATLVSFDAKEAEAIPGVRVVREGNLLGVLAPDPQTASRAARAVKAEWKTETLTPPAGLLDVFRQTAREPVAQPGARYPALIRQGAVDEGLAAAAHRSHAAYTLDYIAHVPLEPRCAIASFEDGKLTVRSGGQSPFGVRREVANALSIPETNVRVIGSDAGGAFGGKQRGEVEIEAALLARAAGKPVRLAWTRADEFLAGYFRPAALVEVRAGLDAGGKVTAWDFHNYGSGASGLPTPYNIPHVYCGFHPTASPLRHGSYRSLAAVANTFARESHMDELAAVAGLDPLEFRLRNLADARLKEALTRGAEAFGWGKRKPGKGAGHGIASTIEKEGRLALFAEVEAGPPVKVRRLTLVCDFGAALNPDNLKNQVAGAMIMGLGGALFERIRFDDRAVLNARLSAYRVPRFSDVPAIEVLLIDRRDEPPAGAGEAAITVVAPAIAAALYAADGRRRRALPMAVARTYAEWVEEERKAHEAKVRAEDGWLSYAGLAWLEEGVNQVPLPETALTRTAAFELRGSQVYYQGRPVKSDHPGPAEIITIDGVKLHVIVRGGRTGIRIRDNASPARRAFTGLRWFPINEQYRVRAKWIAYPVPKTVTTKNVLGMEDQETAPGCAEFTLLGRTMRLEPVDEDGRLFYVFRDRTAGKQTYPAARFLYSDQPRDGEVVLDFNLAHSPACAFTESATCPLPRRGNLLPVAIEAGELYPPGNKKQHD